MLGTCCTWCTVIACVTVLARGNGAPLASGIVVPLLRTPEDFYVASVGLGSNSQRVRLLIDTGSHELWAPMNDGAFPRSTTKESVPPAAEASTNWNDLGNTTSRPFSASYGRGHVSGVIVAGHLDLAQGENPTCEYGLASTEEGIWSQMPSMDGVWGLAPGVGPAAQQGIASCLGSVMTLQLMENGGSLTVGAPALDVGQVINLPVVGDGLHWAVGLSDVTVAGRGKNVAPLELPSPGQAVLDSGSSGVMGPPQLIAQVATHLGASVAEKDWKSGIIYYKVPCDRVDVLPDLVFHFESEAGPKISLPFPAENLVRRDTFSHSSDCDLYLEGWQTGGGKWILGSAFLRRLKALVLDFEKESVGLSWEAAAGNPNHQDVAHKDAASANIAQKEGPGVKSETLSEKPKDSFGKKLEAHTTVAQTTKVGTTSPNDSKTLGDESASQVSSKKLHDLEAAAKESQVESEVRKNESAILRAMEHANHGITAARKAEKSTDGHDQDAKKAADHSESAIPARGDSLSSSDQKDGHDTNSEQAAHDSQPTIPAGGDSLSSGTMQPCKPMVHVTASDPHHSISGHHYKDLFEHDDRSGAEVQQASESHRGDETLLPASADSTVAKKAGEDSLEAATTNALKESVRESFPHEDSYLPKSRTESTQQHRSSPADRDHAIDWRDHQPVTLKGRAPSSGGKLEPAPAPATQTPQLKTRWFKSALHFQGLFNSHDTEKESSTSQETENASQGDFDLPKVQIKSRDWDQSSRVSRDPAIDERDQPVTLKGGAPSSGGKKESVAVPAMPAPQSRAHWFTGGNHFRSIFKPHDEDESSQEAENTPQDQFHLSKFLIKSSDQNGDAHVGTSHAIDQSDQPAINEGSAPSSGGKIESVLAPAEQVQQSHTHWFKSTRHFQDLVDSHDEDKESRTSQESEDALHNDVHLPKVHVTSGDQHSSPHVGTDHAIDESDEPGTVEGSAASINGKMESAPAPAVQAPQSQRRHFQGLFKSHDEDKESSTSQEPETLPWDDHSSQFDTKSMTDAVQSTDDVASSALTSSTSSRQLEPVHGGSHRFRSLFR